MTGSEVQGNKISRSNFIKGLGAAAIGYFAYRAGFGSNSFGIATATAASARPSPSYIIYIDQSGGSVKARNGNTGTIDYNTKSAPANSADTTTLLNNVFTALQSTGGLVLLTTGTYVINNSINVGKSDGTLPGTSIVVMGEGMDNTIVRFDATAVTPADSMLHAWCNATFEKFTIDGNGKSNGQIFCNTESYLITEEIHFLNNSSGLVLQSFATHANPVVGCIGQICRGCWFDKTSIGDQCAVGVRDLAIIEGNIFDRRVAGIGANGTTYGSTLTSGSANEMVVSNNIMYKVPSTDPGCSFEPWGSTYNSLLIDGNILVNCRLSIGGLGDWTGFPDGERTHFRRILISNNILQGHSIWVNGPRTTPETATANITNLLIADNQISDPYWMGILVAHVTGPTTIANNLIKDSNFIPPTDQGNNPSNGLISVENSDQVDIINNICHMTESANFKSPFGIKYNSCTNVRVFGNKVINSTANPSIDHSELAGGPNSNITIWDNQGYVTNANGVSTHDGTGSAKAFTVSHGLNVKPTVVTHSTNQNIHSYISAITPTTFTVTFVSPPGAGIRNVSIFWRASKTTFA